MVVTMARTSGEVQHFGVWAHDRESLEAFWHTGRYVPLCGRKRIDSQQWKFTGPDDTRRLCTVCQRHVTAMAATFLAGVTA